MNSDEPEQPPEADPDRTVFQPAPGPNAGASAWTPPPVGPAGELPNERERPVTPSAPADVAQSRLRPIEIGDVLNHIYEVKRFIARGGMGEVFEGANVNSDERVAIKVMLPHLAADPNVQAMFRKEARTLTRISHPALVQYRVLAQEPVLGVSYIVTEYIDGQNLADVIKTIQYTPAELTALLKKLAQGLEVAHALGAIHRDMAPDNVMLEGSRLAGAKIIDFGIAKDLDPGSSTIIGDGFAGKLNYVAPEQLGDFNREVGPWTDVYSLALVILAVAQHGDVNLGGTLVDAVDKRRAGPDISVAPADLQPVLARMLCPNPAERARSMTEVLDLLSCPPYMVRPVAAPSDTAAKKRAPKEPKPPKVAKPLRTDGKSWVGANLPLVAGGGATLGLLLLVGLYFGLSGGSTDDQPLPETPVAQVSAPTGDPVGLARAALSAGLPQVSCTWLDVASVADEAGSVGVVLRGVAGKPAEAQAQISKLMADRGVKVSSINFEGVSPIETTECGALDAFRQIRDPAGGHLAVAQPKFEMAKLIAGNYAGMVGAKAVIDFDVASTGSEMSLFGLEPSGQIDQITPDKATLIGATESVGSTRRMTLDVNHTGWSGLLLLSGRAPFDGALIAGPAGSRSGDWSQRFLATARERGWKAEMAWFKTVDEQPN